MARTMFIVRTDEADIQGIFVGADFRNEGSMQFERNAYHLGYAPAQHQLKRAALGHLLLSTPACAQQSQDDGQSGVQWYKRLQPAEGCSSVITTLAFALPSALTALNWFLS